MADLTADIAAMAGVGTLLIILTVIVLIALFPQHVRTPDDLDIVDLDPSRDQRYAGRAIVTAPTPRINRARHRHQDIAEDTRRMLAGIGAGL